MYLLFLFMIRLITIYLHFEITFEDCKKFNQPLDKWKININAQILKMFFNCKEFNQVLNHWILDKKKICIELMFRNSAMKEKNKPITKSGFMI